MRSAGGPTTSDGHPVHDGLEMSPTDWFEAIAGMFGPIGLHSELDSRRPEGEARTPAEGNDPGA